MIQIVYGSTGGNTQLVCKFIQNNLEKAGFQVQNDRCEHFDENKLTGHELLILAAPTYEHGQLEDHMRLAFWPRIQALDLQAQKCAVVGLGDSKYDTDYNVESGRILQNYVTTHNGTLICKNLMINKCPIAQLETKVTDWTNQLIKILHG